MFGDLDELFKGKKEFNNELYKKGFEMIIDSLDVILNNKLNGTNFSNYDDYKQLLTVIFRFNLDISFEKAVNIIDEEKYIIHKNTTVKEILKKEGGAYTRILIDDTKGNVIEIK